MIMICTVDTSVENTHNLWETNSLSTAQIPTIGSTAQPGDHEWTTKHALNSGNTTLPTIHSTYNSHHLFNSFLYMNRTGTTHEVPL